jgi:photosystem II stability/assembly factor-like uncharacterized protein
LNDATSCASYLFGCGTHAKLAVVDPHAELVDDYLATAPHWTRRSWRSSKHTCVVDASVWWIVAGRSRAVVQITRNAGRRWPMVVARGLPTRRCSVTSVSAAGANVAWVVARDGGSNTALFQTGDGGRTWHRTILLRG